MIYIFVLQLFQLHRSQCPCLAEFLHACYVKVNVFLPFSHIVPSLASKVAVKCHLQTAVKLSEKEKLGHLWSGRDDRIWIGTSGGRNVPVLAYSANWSRFRLACMSPINVGWKNVYGLEQCLFQYYHQNGKIIFIVL